MPDGTVEIRLGRAQVARSVWSYARASGVAWRPALSAAFLCATRGARVVHLPIEDLVER